jgi:carboxylate-amine ligase
VPRTLGVEEEFNLVDRKTRRLTARAQEVLRALSDTYVAELQQCVVEMNSGVSDTLAGLAGELREQRANLVDTAAALGIGVVAAGSVPLSVPAEMQVTDTARYRQMLADYQLLAREQLICGTQIHVGVRDRDEAVAVANRVAPYLPILLALSASSPFSADGTDTGYSSSRTLVWQRWPTTGLSAPVSTAAEYDTLVNDLVASGAIADAGMVYFDVRPASAAPTLELRICDSCPSVDTIVLIAGVFRALVEREAAALHAGQPALAMSPTMGRAAIWRAARSGLEGDLIDINGPAARPASEVVSGLVESLRPQLEESGDWPMVSDLTWRVLTAGSSAARQRRALRRRGRLTDVVDQLIAETSGDSPLPDLSASLESDPSLLFGYHPPGQDPTDTYDEAIDSKGCPRPGYRRILGRLADIGAPALRVREARIEQDQRTDNIVFRVSGQSRAQLFPLDLVPRVIDAADWEHLTIGLGQRARALNLFLQDIYSAQEIIADGVVDMQVIDRASGYRSTGRLSGAPVRAHVSGTDLVCDGAGHWLVLEDNLRVPSGVAYAMVNRRMVSRHVPELELPAAVAAVEGVPGLLLDTLCAAAPPAAPDDPQVVLLSSGWQDSAWFEHTFLAKEMGIPVLSPSDLTVQDGQLVRHNGSHGNAVRPVHVAYTRMDEDMLLSSHGHDGTELRHGLLRAVREGRLTIANALGNGIGDDKAIYAYVPAMIEYYLGEKPALDQVPTWLCADRDQRDHVLDRLDEMVVKPVDGSGGRGVIIGPEASEATLRDCRHELLTRPERYIAQEVVGLSTHPTFDGDGMFPRHVDLRAFVHLRSGPGDSVTAHVMPAGLTRVGPRGSRIVNSSAGGAGKDTWILTSDAGRR